MSLPKEGQAHSFQECEMMEVIEVMTLPPVVTPKTPDQRRPRQTQQARQVARREIVRQVEQGVNASEARRHCPVPMHRTTVYRLLKHVQAEGEHAFIERRHGHPTKLRGEVLTWMLDHCQSHPSTSSADVQRRLSKRFGLSVSVSQLNRVRAAYSVRRVPPPREKKAENGRNLCLRIS